MRTRHLIDIDKVIIHCADTPNGYDRWRIQDITDWHVRDFGWEDIGYHYVIHVEGDCVVGRQLPFVGDHAAGHNTTSIGICLVGRDKYTAEQWATLRELVQKLRKFPNISRVIGHRDVNKQKSCPGFDVHSWMHKQGYEPLPEQVCNIRHRKRRK